MIAFLQLVLIFPAALFMASLVVRNFGSLQYEPAHTAQKIAMWYAGRGWTLRVLLFALPCMVLLSGCVALRTRYRANEQHGTLASSRAHWPVRLVSVTTVASAAILAIVGFHVLTH
jgi:hypothetical protein